MASRIDPRNIVRVHQALHGYSDGHRMLACSTNDLKARDAKTLLVLSDASGPGARTSERGYLTGYPLTESGLYALARTWSAPEMPRPGCVWTHTLLIDFDDLALIERLEVMAGCFERPQVDAAVDTYAARRTVELDPLVGNPPIELAAFFGQLLDALYLQPKARVFLPMDIDAPKEIAVLQVWSQQWPKLRRSFRFCTLAFADRSLSESEQFDLQFGPISALARVRGVVEAPASVVEQSGRTWSMTAVSDLVGGVPGLRSFLRTAGADISDGRAAFAPLVEIFDVMTQARASGSFDSRLVRLVEDHVPPAQGLSLRAAVVNAILESSEVCSDSDIDYVLQNISLLDAHVLKTKAQSFAERIWRKSPLRFADLVNGVPPISSFAQESFASLSSRTVLDGLVREPAIAELVLKARPELLASVDFWRLSSPATDAGFQLLSPEDERLDTVMGSMLVADRGDLAERAVTKFGSRPVLGAVLEYLSQNRVTEPRSAAYAWLRASVVEPAMVAEALARGRAKSWNAMVLLARATTPDTVPNDFGHDPWWIALQGASGNVSPDALQYLSAYVLSRALGYRSRSQAELTSCAFDDVYMPALRSQLNNEAWSILDLRLPRSMWGFEWDRCRRLRAGLIDMFVSRDLLVDYFARVTKSDDVFRELVDEAARTWRGRNYLRHTLEQASLGPRRANMIASALD